MILIFFFSQMQRGKSLGKLRSVTIKSTDKRVSLMSEILTSIKLVKLYGWEKSFSQKVEQMRNNELKGLQKQAIYRVIDWSLSFVGTTLAALVIFGTHVLLGNELEAPTVFSTLVSYYFLLFFSIKNSSINFSLF